MYNDMQRNSISLHIIVYKDRIKIPGKEWGYVSNRETGNDC